MQLCDHHWHYQKRFGRKISLPSNMEIKRDFMAMAQADRIVEDFKKEGGSRASFSETIINLFEIYQLPSDRARMLISRFYRNNLLDEPILSIDNTAKNTTKD